MPSDLDQAVLSLIPPKEALLPNLQREVCALVLSQKGTSQLGIKICRDQELSLLQLAVEEVVQIGHGLPNGLEPALPA